MMIAGGQNELRTCHTPPGPKSCCLVLIARVGLHFNSFGLKPKFVRGRIIAPGGESAPLSVIGQGYCASKYIVTIKEWCFKSQISAWKSRPQNPTPKKGIFRSISVSQLQNYFFSEDFITREGPGYPNTNDLWNPFFISSEKGQSRKRDPFWVSLSAWWKALW